MLWSTALQDDRLLGLALQTEQLAGGGALSMRIAIIGAGIAGVTCAYELAADGHRVCVFERRGSVAAKAVSPMPAWSRRAWPCPGRHPA